MGIKQLKLSSGEEVFCDIVDETEEVIVAKGVLALRDLTEDYLGAGDQTGTEIYGVYGLFPWMTYQTELSELCIINKRNVIGYVVPSIPAQEYYTKTFVLLQEAVRITTESVDSDGTDFAKSNVLTFRKNV